MMYIQQVLQMLELSRGTAPAETQQAMPQNHHTLYPHDNSYQNTGKSYDWNVSAS